MGLRQSCERRSGWGKGIHGVSRGFVRGANTDGVGRTGGLCVPVTLGEKKTKKSYKEGEGRGGTRGGGKNKTAKQGEKEAERLGRISIFVKWAGQRSKNTRLGEYERGKAGEDGRQIV